jgi:hypothetical protein
MSKHRGGTRNRRAARSALALAGVTAGLLFGPQTPAKAAEPEPCPFAGVLCLYDGTNFAGERFNVAALEPEGTCVSLVDHGWGDRARSAINTNGRSAAMFANDDCVGGPFQVPANSTIADLGGFRPNSVFVYDRQPK